MARIRLLLAVAILGSVAIHSSVAQSDSSATTRKENAASSKDDKKGKKDLLIRIISATYGYKHKTCSPTLSLCNGTAKCEFNVDDGLCAVDAPVKNLEVVWDCGPGTEKHARAEAKGGRISLECKQQ
jgi:hypothetical protein